MSKDLQLSHLNSREEPDMVDVSNKEVSQRMAKARARIWVGKEILSQLKLDNFNTKKGSIIQTAIIAGQMAVKNTSQLIPLCHPLRLTSCHIEIDVIDDERLEVNCEVKAVDRTGVEMEALTGASIAALTLYDMLKALSQALVIEEVRLLEKHGGKNDYSFESKSF